MEWKMMSMGEVADKLMILKVKCEKLSGEKRQMAQSQHDFIVAGLEQHNDELVMDNKERLLLANLMLELHKNHRIQWDAEDDVFSATDPADGVRAAKLSRKYNIRRAELKKQIDVIYGETFLEVKDYASAKELE